VLLVHGSADPVVPYASMAAARAALQAVGIEVACETRPGLAHAIDEEGLARAGAVLAAAFVPATT
jgi:phospholipase/carboxylesterase